MSMTVLYIFFICIVPKKNLQMPSVIINAPIGHLTSLSCKPHLHTTVWVFPPKSSIKWFHICTETNPKTRPNPMTLSTELRRAPHRPSAEYNKRQSINPRCAPLIITTLCPPSPKKEHFTGRTNKSNPHSGEGCYLTTSLHLPSVCSTTTAGSNTGVGLTIGTSIHADRPWPVRMGKASVSLISLILPSNPFATAPLLYLFQANSAGTRYGTRTSQ